MRQILAAIFVVCFSASSTFAATTIVRHADKDCSAFNGDGTSASCAASNGGVGAYSSWALADDDINADYAAFGSSDVIVQLQLHAGADDTTAVYLDGSTMDATRYMDVVCDSGYKLVTSDATASLRIGDTHVRITGCWIENTSTGKVVKDESGVAGGDIRIIRSRLVGGTHGWAMENDGNNTQHYLIDSWIYSSSDSGMSVITNGYSGQGYYFFNSTVRVDGAGDNGIFYQAYGSTDTLKMRNVVFSNCSSGNCINSESTFATTAYSTVLTADGDSPSGGSYQNKECTYVDTATGDLHLTSGDTNCKDAGTDLSADGDYPFSTDIDGDAMGTWPIGADEYVATTPGFSTLNALGEL